MFIWLVIAQNLLILGLLVRLSKQLRKHRDATEKNIDVLRRLMVAIYIRTNKTSDQ